MHVAFTKVCGELLAYQRQRRQQRRQMQEPNSSLHKLRMFPALRSLVARKRVARARRRAGSARRAFGPWDKHVSRPMAADLPASNLTSLCHTSPQSSAVKPGSPTVGVWPNTTVR